MKALHVEFDERFILKDSGHYTVMKRQLSDDRSDLTDEWKRANTNGKSK